MEENLGMWLNLKIEELGWSQRELARRAGVSHTTVADVVSESRVPTADFVARIAKVLGERPEKLLAMTPLSDLVPDAPEDDLSYREILECARRLTPEERARVREYIEWRYSVQQRRAAP